MWLFWVCLDTSLKSTVGSWQREYLGQHTFQTHKAISVLCHVAISINNVFNRSVLFWYYKHCNVHLKHIKSNTHVLCAISIMKLCHVILWYCSLESPVLSQEITKVRESIPHIGLLSNVSQSKLIFDMATRTLRGYFGRICHVSLCSVWKRRKTSNALGK